MAYPKVGKYAVKLYYNTVNTLDEAKVLTLYPLQISPQPEAERDSSTFLNNVMDSVGKYRKRWTMPLEPHQFPDDIANQDNILDKLSDNNYFWLETHSTGNYPLAFATTPLPIAISDVPEVEPLLENSERQLTITFAKRTL